MKILRNKIVQRYFSLQTFSEVLEELEREQEIEFKKLTVFPWDQYENIISRVIINVLSNLRHHDDIISENKEIPIEGLKGLYFSIGDESDNISIIGSLLFDEIDWAAHFLFSIFLEELRDTLDEITYHLKENKYSYYEIEEFMLIFFTFITLKILHRVDKIPEISNAHVAIGYSSGDELILGKFNDGIFNKKFRFIADEPLKNPSSVQYVPQETKLRGPIWKYLLWNYRELIEENGLHKEFDLNGEDAAKNISISFQDHILINRCDKRNFIKKTPRARLCLRCGDFSKTGL